MAIAGGLAYNYENYVSELGSGQGNFKQVWDDTVLAFKNDFRLIKPKKFGFKTDGQLREEIELR